jgi:hypothetical protein
MRLYNHKQRGTPITCIAWGYIGDPAPLTPNLSKSLETMQKNEILYTLTLTPCPPHAARLYFALYPMRGDYMELPQSAQEIADVIGREKTLLLIGRLPRSPSRCWRVNLYVPKRMPLDHWLIDLLGFEDAEKLRRMFGGEILQPSNCNQIAREFRNREVRRMSAAGMNSHEIAQAVDLTPRQVRNILAESPPEEKPAMNDNDPGNAAQGVSGELDRTG